MRLLLEVTSAARLRPWQRCAEVPWWGRACVRAQPPGGCSRGHGQPVPLGCQKELQLPSYLGGGAPRPRTPLAVASPHLAPFIEGPRGSAGLGPLGGDARRPSRRVRAVGRGGDCGKRGLLWPRMRAWRRGALWWRMRGGWRARLLR